MQTIPSNQVSQRPSVGKFLVEGWKKNSLPYLKYIELAKEVGKEEAIKKYTPIMTYINWAYYKYCELSYYFGRTPLKKGAWLRSEPASIIN